MAVGVEVSCDLVVVVAVMGGVTGFVGVVSAVIELVTVSGALGGSNVGEGVTEDGGAYPNPELRESLILIPAEGGSEAKPKKDAQNFFSHMERNAL